MKLLILDEPTASLSEKDSDALLALLMEFRSQGISSILISHKLNEVGKVADRITILRDGKTIETLDRQDISEDRIITSMVGRTLEDRYPARTPNIGETIFEVKNWVVHHPLHPDRQIIKGVDISVRKGEVVGIAGLMGAGRTEFAMSVFGKSYGTRISGEVCLHGKKIDASNVGRAVENGIAYATEDRKTYGLNLIDHIKHNISIANLGGVSSAGVHRRHARAQCRQRLPQEDQHPLVQRLSDDRQSFRRQPAEGGAVEMAVRQPGRADP